MRLYITSAGAAPASACHAPSCRLHAVLIIGVGESNTFAHAMYAQRAAAAATPRAVVILVGISENIFTISLLIRIIVRFHKQHNAACPHWNDCEFSLCVLTLRCCSMLARFCNSLAILDRVWQPGKSSARCRWKRKQHKTWIAQQQNAISRILIHGLDRAVAQIFQRYHVSHPEPLSRDTQIGRESFACLICMPNKKTVTRHQKARMF